MFFAKSLSNDSLTAGEMGKTFRALQSGADFVFGEKVLMAEGFVDFLVFPRGDGWMKDGCMDFFSGSC